jgi:hypothetical protein
MKFTLLGSLSCKHFMVSFRLAASPRIGGSGGTSCAIADPVEISTSAVVQNVIMFVPSITCEIDPVRALPSGTLHG